jgi:hypothetical protein
MDYKELEKLVEVQGRTEESKNLLKETLEKCKREKKTPKEALSTINQLIVNPSSMGVC